MSSCSVIRGQYFYSSLYDSDATQEYYSTHSPPNHSYTPTGDSGDGYLQDYNNDYDNGDNYSRYGWNYDEKEQRYYDDDDGHAQQNQATTRRHSYRTQEGDSYERSYDQDAYYEERDYAYDDKGSSYQSHQVYGYNNGYETAEQDKYGRTYEDNDRGLEGNVQYSDSYHRGGEEFRRYDDYDVSEEQYGDSYKQDHAYVEDGNHQRDIYEPGDSQTKGRNDDTTFNEYSFEDDQMPYDSFEKTEGSFDEYVKDSKGYVANSLTKDSGYHTYDRRVSEEIPYDRGTTPPPPVASVMAEEAYVERGPPRRGQLQERKSQSSSLSVQSQERRPSSSESAMIHDQSAYERKPSRTIEIYDQLHGRQSSTSGMYATLEARTQSPSGTTSSFEPRLTSFEDETSEPPGFSQNVDHQPSREASPKPESVYSSAGLRPDVEALQDVDATG